MAADGGGLVGDAGAALLRLCADRVSLTRALTKALPLRDVDRGIVRVQLAIAIALGATSVMGAEAVLSALVPLFEVPASDSTMHRALKEADDAVFLALARARARVREQVWGLLSEREQGFPWLQVAGKILAGWIVIDLDATLITAHSKKQNAAATWKKGFGFHPLAAWCANTAQVLAMLNRSGNAGSNTAADHITVLSAALRQIPAGLRRRILVRIDGAGFSHELLEHLHHLGTGRRTVRYLTGWTITAADEKDIATLPKNAWHTAIEQDGRLDELAEVTGVSSRTGWPAGLRLIVRRTRPSRRHSKKLTDFEKATGWRYKITATNIHRLHQVPGSHHIQWLDAAARQHAVVQDRVKDSKSLGIRNLPSFFWQINCSWMLAANLAQDLLCWTGLLGLDEQDEQDELAGAEPDTVRVKLLTVPARLTSHARRRILHIPATWRWKRSFTTCWNRLAALPNPG